MKFTAERQPLIAAIKRASGVIASRNTLPVLECALIRAADTGLVIFGSSMIEWAAVKCDAAVSGAGAVCVKASTLLAWLSATPSGALVSFELVDGRALLTAGRASADFATLPQEDFPTPEKPDAMAEVVGAIPALAVCLPYAAVSDTRYYLNGVAINAGHAVATDGHRACAVEIGADVSAIIPFGAVQQIIQCSPSARLSVNAHQWACEDDGVRLGGNLIEGEFPDWQRVMPVMDSTASVDADDLLLAIKSVAAASDERGRAVKIVGDGASMSLTSRGSTASATAAVPYEGAAFEFGVNAKYAETVLATFAERIMSFATDGGVMAVRSDSAPGLRVVLIGMRV